MSWMYDLVEISSAGKCYPTTFDTSDFASRATSKTDLSRFRHCGPWESFRSHRIQSFRGEMPNQSSNSMEIASFGRFDALSSAFAVDFDVSKE